MSELANVPLHAQPLFYSFLFFFSLLPFRFFTSSFPYVFGYFVLVLSTIPSVASSLVGPELPIRASWFLCASFPPPILFFPTYTPLNLAGLPQLMYSSAWFLHALVPSLAGESSILLEGCSSLWAGTHTFFLFPRSSELPLRVALESAPPQPVTSLLYTLSPLRPPCYFPSPDCFQKLSFSPMYSQSFCFTYLC